jgi:lysophospholipase L1-like esterase
MKLTFALAATAAVAAMLVSTIHAAAPQPPGPAPAVAAAPAGTPAPAEPTGTPEPAAYQPGCLGCDAGGPIVAIGDSITFGFVKGFPTPVAGTPPPPYAYPAQLQRILGLPVVNAGVDGNSAYAVLHPEATEDLRRPVSLQIPAILAMHPRLVIVGLGTIEAYFGVPLTRAVADLDAVLTALGRVPMVLVGTHVDCRAVICPAPQQQPYTSAWDDALRILAMRHHAGLLLDSERGMTQPVSLSDTAHPTPRGYVELARRIAPVVSARLSASGPGWWTWTPARLFASS